MKHSTANSPRHGFTLIELMVVVSIIIVLLSLLIPSLNQAREISKGMQCASNLKTLGTGLVQYLNDFDSRFMGMPAPLNATMTQYHDAGAYDPGLYNGTLPVNGGAMLDYKPVIHNLYIQTANFSNSAPFIEQKSYNNPHAFRYSYPMNKYVYGYTLSRVTSFAAPTDIALLVDGWSNGNYVFWRTDEICPRHLQKANVEFVDGHVEMASVGDIFKHPQWWGYDGSFSSSTWFISPLQANYDKY